MPSVINTNLPSLNTQRNLGTSQAALATSIQRLSTGLRVNSAKDDAAGLAIAERMNAQVRGLNVAARNANDGVSLSQTAEGSLGKIGDMVQRMRELAVQASNATNSDADRGALQAEVAQLKNEIDRVATSSNFNGTKLLDGSFTDARFQVGADAGQSISIAGITNAKLAGMGALQVATETSDVITSPAAVAAGEIKINGVDIGALPTVATVALRQDQLVAAINAKSDETGVTAALGLGGTIQMTSYAAINVVGSSTASTASVGYGPSSTKTTTLSAATGDMSGMDISTYDGAQKAIRQADAALTQINSARASLGAVQSRFESAISNIQIAAENTTAARSRIMDTDFAAETATLSRAQILQQAGNAMLTQANQLPQQVLALLRN